MHSFTVTTQLIYRCVCICVRVCEGELCHDMFIPSESDVSPRCHVDFPQCVTGRLWLMDEPRLLLIVLYSHGPMGSVSVVRATVWALMFPRRWVLKWFTGFCVRQRERGRGWDRTFTLNRLILKKSVTFVLKQIYSFFNVNSCIFVIYWTVNNQEAVTLIFFMGLFLFTVLRYFNYLLLLALFGVTFIHAE